MTLHTCKICNYVTDRNTLYRTHLLTKKHINNANNTNNTNNILIDKVDNLSKQNIEVLKQNEELKQKIHKIK